MVTNGRLRGVSLEQTHAVPRGRGVLAIPETLAYVPNGPQFPPPAPNVVLMKDMRHSFQTMGQMFP